MLIERLLVLLKKEILSVGKLPTKVITFLGEAANHRLHKCKNPFFLQT